MSRVVLVLACLSSAAACNVIHDEELLLAGSGGGTIRIAVGDAQGDHKATEANLEARVVDDISLTVESCIAGSARPAWVPVGPTGLASHHPQTVRLPQGWG